MWVTVIHVYAIALFLAIGYILTSIICFTDQAAALENLNHNHDESRNRIDDIQSQLQQTTHDVTDSYRSNQGVYTTIHYNNDCTL